MCVIGQIGLNLSSLLLFLEICISYSFIKKYLLEELLFGMAVCTLIQRKRYRSYSESLRPEGRIKLIQVI